MIKQTIINILFPLIAVESSHWCIHILQRTVPRFRSCQNFHLNNLLLGVVEWVLSWSSFQFTALWACIIRFFSFVFIWVLFYSKFIHSVVFFRVYNLLGGIYILWMQGFKLIFMFMLLIHSLAQYNSSLEW